MQRGLAEEAPRGLTEPPIRSPAPQNRAPLLHLVAGRGHGSSLGLAQSPKKSKLVSAREEEEGEEETKADDEEKGKDEERRLGRWIEMARVQDLIPAPI